MQPLQIAVLAGTTRAQRVSIHAAKLVAEVGRQLNNVAITFVDPVDLHFDGDGNDPEGKNPKYTAIVEKAEAFFIVTPEYNHSFPGSLKRMLDSELSLYIHKPVAFAGCSSQRWGGVRAIEALTLTVRELGLVPTFSDVNFPQIQTLFDADGELIDPSYRKYIESAYEELIWMAQTLKWGRQHVKSRYH
jgi:NAD(P)H-dependent FMN reductase